jgi:DNA-binding MarR family transcriptional regulator
MPTPSRITTREYRALAELRYVVRKFLSFSAEAARAASVEPQQHQLLLAIKGLPPDLRPTISVTAERLQLQHNSAVELVKRSIEHGLLERRGNKNDRREVLLHITPSGERVLRRLSLAHRSELRAAAPVLLQALEEVVGQQHKGRKHQ